MSSDRFSSGWSSSKRVTVHADDARGRARRAGSVGDLCRATRQPAGGRGAGKRRQARRFRALLRAAALDDGHEIVPGLGLRIDRWTPSSTSDAERGAGAAWAASFGRPTALPGLRQKLVGDDETAWTYRSDRPSGLDATCRRHARTLARAIGGHHAAFTVNEIERVGRARVLERLLTAREKGARVLVVEPIARRLTPWWDEWRERFRRAGGRADEWRFRVQLPDRLRLLGRSAGLDHREITARTLFRDGAVPLAGRSRSHTRATSRTVT